MDPIACPACGYSKSAIGARLCGNCGEPLPVQSGQTVVVNSRVQVDKLEGGSVTGVNIGKIIGTVIFGSDEARELRNRQRLLKSVWDTWIEGVYRVSLHNEVLIDFGMEHTPDAVAPHWDIKFRSDNEVGSKIPEGTPMMEVFNQANGSLLILGEPGSGKTTMLLELAKQSIELAQKDETYSIPVILRLSSWIGDEEEETLSDWIITELKERYSVSENIATDWVDKDRLLLFLDGLDEVKNSDRLNCADAINEFRLVHGSTGIVVTSRIKDFEELSLKLKFNEAVQIKPFSKSQVREYFEKIGIKQQSVQKLFQGIDAFQDLTKSPLMLNIIALTYKNKSKKEYQEQGTFIGEQEELFDAYIEEMFDRRSLNQPYDRNDTKHWLSWLARKLVQNSRESIFVPENIEPNWVDNTSQELVFMGSYVMPLAIVFGLLAGITQGPIRGLLWFVLAIPLATLFLGGISMRGWDALEVFSWSWNGFRARPKSAWKPSLIIGIGISVYQWLSMIGIIEGEWKWEPFFFFSWFQNNIPSWYGTLAYLVFLPLATIVLYTTIAAIDSGIYFRKRDRRDKPLLGYWQKEKLTAITSLVIGIVFGIWVGYLNTGNPQNILIGILAGIALLTIAARDYIQYTALRIMFYRNNSMPWNYRPFLEFCTERIFLRRVGFGYIFIHRLLMEHFAEMELNT